MNSFSLGLDFETQTEMQKNVITFLGIYCYHGDFYSFWQMGIISFILLLITSTTLITLTKNELLNFIKYILFLQGLIHYFFWVFVHKYSPIFENQLLPNFYYSILYLFGIQISEFIIIWAIYTIILKFSKKNKKDGEMQVVSYKCPNCGKIFQSNVSFCSSCLKEIKSIEIPLNKHF
jgi:DNA-directed RNA polymerase subunit RPC12/RpoP